MNELDKDLNQLIRDVIYKENEESFRNGFDEPLCTATEYLAEILTEKLQETGYRKQSEGEWITETVNWVYDVKKKYCSACGTNARYDTHMREYILTNFCPTCGAKMKGGME
jgi:predicted RNA-binding Zn-ribbon protein involved in translation (DUF1610 family)